MLWKSLLLALLLLAVAYWLTGFGGLILCCAQKPRLFEAFLWGAVPVLIGMLAFRQSIRTIRRSIKRRSVAWAAGLLIGFLAILVDTAIYLQVRDLEQELRPTWNAQTGDLDWRAGRVTLPHGFEHQTEQGIDSLVGQLSTSDGRVVIRYDIGAWAGEHGGLRGVLAERLINGARVRTVHGGHNLSAASFPDSGCAFFYTNSPGTESAAAIDQLAASFQPRRHPFNWLRPLLPEVLRSDCKYRFRSLIDL